jgi:hypothetical protein
MLLKALKTKEIAKLSETLAPKLVEHKLFRFLCPEREEREAFIEAYFNYYIPRWMERGDYLLIDENFDALVVLQSPRSSSHKFSGKGAKKLKKYPNAPAIFFYRGNLAYIVHLIAPRGRRLKVMTIFADKTHSEAALNLVDEAIGLSYQYRFNLMYDTLTRRHIEDMKEKGFVVSYQKMFASTTFVQTLMILNKEE